MPKPVKQYVCVVDGYRRQSRQRNTQGRYRVAAKDPRSAKSMLQRAIGFGSVQILFEDKDPEPGKVVPCGQCRKELPDGTLVPALRYDMDHP